MRQLNTHPASVYGPRRLRAPRALLLLVALLVAGSLPAAALAVDPSPTPSPAPTELVPGVSCVEYPLFGSDLPPCPSATPDPAGATPPTICDPYGTSTTLPPCNTGPTPTPTAPHYCGVWYRIDVTDGVGTFGQTWPMYRLDLCAWMGPTTQDGKTFSHGLAPLPAHQPAWDTGSWPAKVLYLDIGNSVSGSGAGKWKPGIEVAGVPVTDSGGQWYPGGPTVHRGGVTVDWATAGSAVRLTGICGWGVCAGNVPTGGFNYTNGTGGITVIYGPLMSGSRLPYMQDGGTMDAGARGTAPDPWTPPVPGRDCVEYPLAGSDAPVCEKDPEAAGPVAPLSGCTTGKLGLIRYTVLPDNPFPGLTLDMGVYFQWLGNVMASLGASIGNGLAYLWNCIADALFPCPGEMEKTINTFLEAAVGVGPFRMVQSMVQVVQSGARGSSSVPFASFSVYGATVNLPVVEIAQAASPIRPYLVPVVVLLIALRFLSMVAWSVRAPAPTGGPGR